MVKVDHIETPNTDTKPMDRITIKKMLDMNVVDDVVTETEKEIETMVVTVMIDTTSQKIMTANQETKEVTVVCI